MSEAEHSEKDYVLPRRDSGEKLMEAVVKGLLEGAVTEKTEMDKTIP